MRFSRIDMIDDIDVTKALIKAVEDWGKGFGCDTIIGPIGFTDLDRQGMLFEGFEHLNMFITIYNHPYYPKHLEQLGFVKDAIWSEKKYFLQKKFQIKLSEVHVSQENVMV